MAALAQQAGWNPNTARRYVQFARANGAVHSDRAPNLPALNVNRRLFELDIGQPLELTGDWVIVGDVHVPTTNLDMARRVLIVAQHHGLRRLIIAGDLLNNDVFSVHPRTSEPVPWRREMAAARELLRAWLGWFDQVIWLAGNHERRLIRAVYGAFEMEELWMLIIHDKRVTVSRYSWCTIQTPQGIWRITHPRAYSRIPLRTAATIAMREGQHVWTFHEHHLGDGDGPKRALCGGERRRIVRP